MKTNRPLLSTRTARLMLPLAIAHSAIFSAAPAMAQSDRWPSRPIRIIHSVPAGGLMDTLARIIAEDISPALGQPVIVESKPGANGTVSAEYVANSAPDGYTLLLVTNAQIAVNPHLQKMRFNPLTDLRHISQFALAQNMLVVRPDLPVHSVDELIAYARKEPGKLTYGSSGNGSLQHIGAELFQRMTGTKFIHAPYKGGAPARLDLLAGNIDLMFGDMGAIPSVQAGKLRALAVTGSGREASVPDIPTLAEAGLTGYSVEGYYLLSAPARIPDSIAQRLAALMAEAVKKPEVIKRINSVFMRPATDTSPEFVNALLKREYDQYGKLIREAGIQID